VQQAGAGRRQGQPEVETTMRHWSVRAVAAWCLAAGSASAQTVTEVTLVTDDNHPPYAFFEKGRPAGIYVEVMQRVFERMPGYRVRVVTAPWKRALRMAEAGEVFGIFPPHHFPGERPYLSKFSSPVLEEVPVVACAEAALARKRVPSAGGPWPDGYRALVFGVSAGVRMGGDAFWRQVERGEIKIEPAPSVRENLRKVAHGRVDCHINDRLTIAVTWQQLLQATPALAATRLVEVAALPPEAGYLALSRDGHPGAVQDDFLTKFNAELEKLQRSGELKTVVEHALDVQREAVER
jgi:polar amino acid transport system substrate-binding protein